ncbi:hypothetical protein ACFFKZ_12705 [Neisseria gonorrhoeae]
MLSSVFCSNTSCGWISTLKRRLTSNAHQYQAEGNLRNRFVEHRLAHGANRRFQLFRTRVGRHPARFDVGGGDTSVIAVEKGEEIDGEIAFVVIGQRTDDAEIKAI